MKLVPSFCFCLTRKGRPTMPSDGGIGSRDTVLVFRRKWRAWMDRILSLSLTEYVSDACQERLFLEGLYNPGGRTSLLAFVGDFAR